MHPSLRPGPAPQLDRAVYRVRRDRVAATMPSGSTLLVATHTEALFANDVHYRFRPQSDFWYLSGFGEPNALLMVQSDGRSAIWLAQRDAKWEIWNGRRIGTDRAQDELDFDAVYDIESLKDTLPNEVRGKQLFGILKHDVGLGRKIHRLLGKKSEDGRHFVAQQRCIKDQAEMRLMRKSARIGMEAMELGAAEIYPGSTEHQVEAAILAKYRQAGCENPAYPPIVGSGENAAILHYVRNQDKIKAGQLVLIDAGCTWGHYASDITRTFPSSGKWTKTQEMLYELVDEARKKAIAAVKPGNRLNDPHIAAAKVLTEGLVEARMLAGPVEDAFEERAYSDFFMHGTSHFLGLDVHDAGRRTEDDKKPVKLQEGMVLTVEPGLYFNPDYAPCPKGTAGIGIRIEDDILVTASGRSNLTSRLATASDEVAALVGRNR